MAVLGSNKYSLIIKLELNKLTRDNIIELTLLSPQMNECKYNIFFDNNATTPISKGVLSTVTYALAHIQGNPSSVTKEGRYAKGKIIKARKTIASFLKCKENELIFTSGGTESIYSLIHGICSDQKQPIITTRIEHKSVLNATHDTGLPIKYLTVDSYATPSLTELVELAKNGASAIVLSLVNGETGSLLPVREIADIATKYSIPFILDGVAALGKMDIPLYPGISGIAFSGHKCHGPKGTGFFYKKADCSCKPTFKGGMQEYNLRAGTENVAGILGLATAVEEINIARYKHLRNLRDTFESRIKEIFPNSSVNGGENRAPNVSNIYFKDIDGDHLLIFLDSHGVSASLGSACSSGSLEPSHVLLGLGLTNEKARSSLRFSFGNLNSLYEVTDATKLLQAYKEQFSTILL